MDGKCKSVHLSRKCFRKCFLKQSPYCGITRLKIKLGNYIHVSYQYNKNATEGMFDNLIIIVGVYCIKIYYYKVFSYIELQLT